MKVGVELPPENVSGIYFGYRVRGPYSADDGASQEADLIVVAAKRGRALRNDRIDCRDNLR